GENWIDQFLRRYKPSLLSFPANRAAQDTLPSLIRNGVIPLSVNDLINLTLTNNLDIAVNRLAPIQSGFGIDVSNRPFEPTLRIAGSVARDTAQSRSQFTGTSSVTQLSHTYSVGYGQTLKTGADIAVDFNLHRDSTSSAGVSTYNPSWYGQMRYTYTQHVLKGLGRTVNTRGIRIAQNNKTISEIQFERQVIDLVTAAQKTYWDLAF